MLNETYDVIVIDGFNISKFSEAALLSILEGQSAAIHRKGLTDKHIQWRKSVIIISNYDPPELPAFRNRVTMVYADVRYWLGQQIVIAKLEPPADGTRSLIYLPTRKIA